MLHAWTCLEVLDHLQELWKLGQRDGHGGNVPVRFTTAPCIGWLMDG
jgi:hypothetical protein